MVIKIQSWTFLLTFGTKNKSEECCFSQSSLAYRYKRRDAIVIRIWLLITSSQITHAVLHKAWCSSVGSWVYTESQLPPGAAASLTLVHWTLLCLTSISHLPLGVWIDYHIQWAPPAAAPERSHLRCSKGKWENPPHSYFAFMVVPKQGWLCPQCSLWKLDFLAPIHISLSILLRYQKKGTDLGRDHTLSSSFHTPGTPSANDA